MTCVALLRAVNVAGHQPVAMADLRALLSHLGYVDGRSLLQSGNLVFKAGGGTAAEIEEMLERAAKRRLGLDTKFFVRTAAEWDDVVAGNPFSDEAKDAPARLVVTCVDQLPTPAAVRTLQAAILGPERLAAGSRHLYIVYPEGMGTSKLTTVLIEKKLGGRSTSRNWNTVLKIQAAAHDKG